MNDLPWTVMQRKLKKLAPRRMAGQANIHIKGPAPVDGACWTTATLLAATNAALPTAADTRTWSSQQRLGVYARASRQEI